jgi:Uma2 family endonuclease
MAAMTSPETSRAAPPLSRRPITVGMYHRMGEAGIVVAGDRVELIEGELVDMAPIGSEHAAVVKYLNRVLTLALRERAIVSVQDPIRFGDHSEPQPDVVVVRPRDDYYREAHPGPEDVLLLIEVADTTARYDREVKVPLYARHAIPEVWLLDLPEKRLEVYYGPEAGEYRHVDYYRSGTVSPKGFPDLVVDLAGLGWA